MKSGVVKVYPIPQTQSRQIVHIGQTMGAAFSVAVSGVDMGFRILSDITLVVGCCLWLFVLLAGPSQHVVNSV
ncbi:BCCT family transporter, partial [Pseudomonas aeruginosa]|uniref:BCCT family transporter n=1 Tax=Pseudomonas aeruginosa TaxID=287 RepID=UPI003CC620DF